MAGEHPCGRDPRTDMSPTAPFLVVKDAYDLAKESERNIERGFEHPDEARKADQDRHRGWSIICERGPEVIGTIGKDLRVSVWLTEALLRQHGLGGLRDGLHLTGGLVQHYWEGVFPQPDPEPDEDDDPRLFPFAALAGSRHDCRLAPALRKVMLSDGAQGEPVSFWEHERRPSSASADDTRDSVERRLKQSSAEFKRDLVEDAEACVAAAEMLEKALEARYDRDAPGFSGIRELIGQIADAVRPHADLPVPAEDSASAEPAPADEQAHAPLPVAAARLPANGLDRQSAFRQLEEIATFFRRTEPHSPIAYALENIVRRGRMSLPELLRELISDDTARQSYLVNAGMQPPEDKSP